MREQSAPEPPPDRELKECKSLRQSPTSSRQQQARPEVVIVLLLLKCCHVCAFAGGGGGVVCGLVFIVSELHRNSVMGPALWHVGLSLHLRCAVSVSHMLVQKWSSRE